MSLENNNIEVDEDGIVYVNTDNEERIKLDDCGDLFKNREQSAQANIENNLTIILKSYNRIEKVKRCVGYLLEYTSHIDFELILCDNGSDDGTFEFFKTVEHPNKKIYKVSKNIGPGFPGKIILKTIRSKYLIDLADDIYVTKNWLDNMMACMESDIRIARVAPMSSNMSNKQNPGLKFNTIEEMQEKAAIFNSKSDPRKWEERLRVFGAVGLTRLSSLELIGSSDKGFYFDFSDDDLCLRWLRTGQKQMVCGDTFIHHDHYHAVENDPVKYQQSLAIGRENFKQKHFGLDAWVDMLNYEQVILSMPNYSKDNSNILGIDCLLGLPLQEIRSKFKLQNNFNTNLYAFTTHAKYYHDLQYVTDGKVQCDRINYINDYYPKSAFDMLFIGEYLNKYSEPLKVLEATLDLLVPGGQLLIKFKNTLDVRTFLALLGSKKDFHQDIYSHLMIDDFIAFLNNYGVSEIKRLNLQETIDDKTKRTLKTKLGASANEVFIKEVYFCITK